MLFVISLEAAIQLLEWSAGHIIAVFSCTLSIVLNDILQLVFMKMLLIISFRDCLHLIRPFQRGIHMTGNKPTHAAEPASGASTPLYMDKIGG